MPSLRIVFAVCFMSGALSSVAADGVDFENDVRPILASKCFHCHGPDAESRQGDLRLDTADDAARVVMPGKPDQSELFHRITSRDEYEQMPPPDSELSLSQNEIAVLGRWIEQGAAWVQHWSLRPLEQPSVPGSDELPDAWVGWSRNAIDRFVLKRHAEHGFHPAPEADRRTLIRRVTFDLTGLPPTPEQVDDFLADTSEDAYERLVDRLLDSPHYGERWARHWMDTVHYADTHGHDEDAIRENAWPYRDYLIKSFNSDKPYARFIREQIAGDVLFPDSPAGTIAIGMLAAGPWDESSQMGIQDGTVDKTIARYLDRDDMISTAMNTFVSMTVHCARCHHHKFDPISLEDYYSLQAVFAGVDRVERPYDPNPEIARRRRQLRREQTELAADRLPETTLLGEDIQARVAAWERNRPLNAWRVLLPETVTATGDATVTRNPDGSVLFSGKRPETDVYTITARIDSGRVAAVRLEVMTDPSLSQNGPGRQDNGNLHLSEFRLLAATGDNSPEPVALHRPVADFNQDGWTIAHALDGNPSTAWGIFPQTGQSHQAVFELREPIEAASGVTLTFVLEQLHGGGHLIGRPRLSITSASVPRLAHGDLVPPPIESILAIERADRTKQQRVELARYVLERENAAALAALPEPARVYAIASDFPQQGNFVPARTPRPVHVLQRGNVLTPVKPAVPGALSCLEKLEARFSEIDRADEGARRAALADWLSARENVLTWRSIVNRVWHYHFGRGIAATPNDFGRNGSPPTHPQLLDWLAVQFRDGGGSLKELHRLILTSATYRQSSQHNAAFSAVDQDNRWLWRMNRRRLDAESARDAVLQMSGLADWTMGGPPARQFTLSKGVHVTPTVDYAAFDVDSPAARRRSVYRFIFRTVPDPFMDALDCPDGSQFAPKRSTSMTSLQALAMLNNQFVVRYSQHIASRLRSETTDPNRQVQRLFALAYGRPPTEPELTAVVAYARQHGLANACRVIVNSNEFMFVN